jgi:hypothetical protein
MASTPLKEPDSNDLLWDVVVKATRLLFAVVRGDVGLLVRGNVGRAPYTQAQGVTPDDNETITVTRALYIGGAGDVSAFINSQQVTFKAVPVGTILPVAATAVYATGTTATHIVALY